LPLIKKLIKNSSSEKDIILDCFSGSGTTCVAAKELKRQFIGIEQNEEYLEWAMNRLRFVKKKTMGVIFFDEELVVGEDTVWNIKLLDQGGNIVVAYEQWYFYAQNEASVTHKYDENMKEYIADKLYAVQKLVEINPKLQKNYNALMVEEITSRLIKSFLLHNDNVMSYREKKMYLKNFLKENPFKEIYQFHVRFNKTGIKLLFIKLDLILPLYIVWRNIKHEN